MMFKRSLKVLIALGLTLGVCLVAGPSAAQEPPGKQLREAPSAPEAARRHRPRPGGQGSMRAPLGSRYSASNVR